MPIKSQAQRRKFAELLMKGEISEEVYERWNREAGYKVLPERVTPKKGTKGKRRTTARKAARKATTRKTTAQKRKTVSKSKTKAKKRFSGSR